MEIDLEELKRLKAAATPLDWIAVKHKGRNWVVRIYGADIAPCEREEDAAYIVAACNALPALIERLERAEAEVTADAANLRLIAGALCCEPTFDSIFQSLRREKRKGHALVSLEQLEEIEYSDYSSDDPDDDDPKCPVCGVWRSVTRHGDDCWLDAKIKEAEGE